MIEVFLNMNGNNMKKVFKKSYLLQNGGCYNDNKMIKLTAPRLNEDDDIFILEILESPVPLVDKYYFVIKHCELKNDKILDLMLHVTSKTMEHYESINHNDFDEIYETIKDSYRIPKKFNDEMVSLHDKLKDIGTESINDTKFIAHGLYHIVDLIDIINNKEHFKYVLDQSYFALKYFIKSMVSRQDLKDDLLKYLKNYTK